MKGVVLLFVLALASCVDSTSKECSWGVTCPAALLCDDTHRMCVSQSQRDACSDEAELAVCSFQGAASVPYHCVAGTCVPAPFCGDGTQGPGEECDCGDGAIALPDGCMRPNGDDPDACRADCKSPTCGDGILDGDEACDDGNTTSGDGCNDGCQFDGCGDGQRMDPEDCEGSDLGGETCESLGFYSGTLACKSICRFETSGCGGRCGDGVLAVAEDEQCDGANLNGMSTCADIGYQSGTLACSPLCRYTGCTGYCGDGVQGGAEECDGNDLGGETCAGLGLVGGTLSCNPDCTLALRECDGGVCRQVVDDNGNTEEVFDDAACGSIACSGWYVVVGQQAPTTAKACHGRMPITTLRCETGDACKDPNSADCDTQLPAASPQVTCGVCQFVNGCTGATPGTCSPYAAFTKTTLCRECDGSTTTPRAAADDIECGTVSCADFYSLVSDNVSPSTLATETCYAHFDRTANRCASADTCFSPNTAAACDTQPLLLAPAATCGVCKRMQTGTCSGTTDPVCVNDTNGALTSGTCGVGACVAFKQCQGGIETCTPLPAASTDDPDDSFVDSNCDGVDGIAANAIFVATDGNDANPGTMAQPKQTIQAAINAANAAMPKKAVYVSNGTYSSTGSSITLASGVSIYGGYNRAAGWTRSDTHASINGNSTAVVGISVSNVVIDRLAIAASSATVAGASSYAVRLDSASTVTIRRSSLSAGNGADGADGSTGGVGSDGEDGEDGVVGTCTAPSRGPGGGGCNRGGVGGAAGAGQNGDGGAGGNGAPDPTDGGIGGAGGGGGNGGFMQTAPQTGQDAGSGDAGADGTGAGSFGATSTSIYLPPNGSKGGLGEDGGGGGGGGGSAGSYNLNCPSNAEYGTSGGGGGGGGCGGEGGAGGQGGGGSFALWVNSSTGITVTNCELTTAKGGSGGDGGSGGNGGAGGLPGGAIPGPFGGGIGALGGDGGRGGRGGTGGGGGGGPSIGIVQRASTVTQTTNTITLGLPGGGGSVSGASGISANVHTLP